MLLPANRNSNHCILRSYSEGLWCLVLGCFMVDTYGYFISTFSIPIGVTEKSSLLSILNTFKKGHQQEDLIIDSRFISLNQWPEWQLFGGFHILKTYFWRKQKFTPLKFDMDIELNHSFIRSCLRFPSRPIIFRIYSSMFLGCSSFHYIVPCMAEWVISGKLTWLETGPLPSLKLIKKTESRPS